MSIQSSRTNELRQAIQVFAASTRFQLLKKLQVGRLMPEGCGDVGSVQELTFENVVELGSERIVSSMSLSALQEARLIELLRALSIEQGLIEAEPDEERPDERDDSIFDPPVVAEESPEENPLSSVQLEINLRHCLEALRSHENYGSIRRVALGTFWDSSWTPAPFEEALTLEQLAGMDLTVLFKKRMVNDKRITCMVTALERALRSLNQSSELEPITSSNKPTPRLPSRGLGAGSALPSRWMERGMSPAPVDAALIELLVMMAQDPRYTSLQHLLRSVMNTLEPEEFVDLAQEREVSQGIEERARTLVRSLSGEPLCDLVNAALRGPAIALRVVSEALSALMPESEVFRSLFSVLVLRALGARAVRWKGRRCPGYWTRNQAALERLIRSKRQAGDVDPELLQWCKDQEGQKNRGNGSRNTRVRR